MVEHWTEKLFQRKLLEIIVFFFQNPFNSISMVLRIKTKTLCTQTVKNIYTVVHRPYTYGFYVSLDFFTSGPHAFSTK